MRDFSNTPGSSLSTTEGVVPGLPKPARRRTMPKVTRLDPRRLSRNFLSRVESPSGFDVLFEHLSDLYFFVKDGEGRFVRVNEGFIKLVRAAREEEVIGAKDSHFFPEDLAENYM